ncbi:MAG: TIGR02147 family protein [Halobacteriovoraceae bacterium]|nr:TIGR02147 family protein [Halobacteriovoraceae bacterium]
METPTLNCPREWIREEYSQKRSLDKSFSIRNFAKVLGVTSGRLSELMSGKRNFSEKMGVRISRALAYDPQTEERFVESIRKAKQQRKSKNLILENTRPEADNEYMQLSEDTYKMLSEWYYFGILNLISVEGFKFDSLWISRRLGISVVEVQSAVDRMKRLGVLREIDGTLKRTRRKLRSSTDIESRAIKLSHRQKLQHSIVALEKVPVELRDITSMTFPTNKEKMGQAKKLITEFRRGLTQLLEKGECDEVYSLNIQLVPLTQIQEGR